ncbi:hypothetical protein [Sabulicella glaciei]|uniref:DUF4089 domain-containing protein n=1 Tax=Sabulicella glaciei TaxID=2984948 RepID=A0ABT3NSK2_9PROT|nr:hypothetical protein [Roseococcus sp. MDT2-1-1]MCW8085139.1 hypothetical protein [Roseococcus sp. MDT2-1-1]
MPEPLPPAEFAALLVRAGIALPEREAEDLRLAHPRLLAMLATLRDPPPAAEEEPAFTFAAGDEA